jgi:hypothetical protein
VGHDSLIPDRVFEGQQAVPFLRISLENPALDAGAISLGGLVFRVEDGQGSGLAPAAVLKSLSLAGQSFSGLPASGASVTLLLASPLTLVSGGGATLTLSGSLADEAQASSLRLGLSGSAAVLAQHASDPVSVVALARAGESFPMLSGLASVDRGSLEDLSNYPNPFAAGLESTRIPLLLKSKARVHAALYDSAGSPVARLLEGSDLPPGLRELSWDGRNGRGEIVRSGVYLLKVRLEDASGSREALRRIAVVR